MVRLDLREVEQAPQPPMHEVTLSDEFSPEQLREVLELQQTDLRIRRVRTKLDDLPEQRELDEAEAKVTELRDQHDAVRVDLERAEAEQRKVDGEIDLLRQRKDAEHARMYSGDISSPKAVQSLRAEIDATERRISENEDALLEIMEKVETLQAQADELTSQHDTTKAEMETLAVKRDEAAQELLAELAELQVQAEAQRKGIPDALLAKYDDRMERLGGTAIGELDGNMCTACRIELPYAEVNELLDGPTLSTCPQCRRLLVISA